MEYKKTVKDGYNAIATQYFEKRTKKSVDIALLDEFTKHLKPNAKVLDAGCGGLKWGRR